MGCGSCGTGTPNGCKSNGSCGTGSCNRMNVYDWLKNIPFADLDGSCKIVEVSFKQGSRKEFYRNITLQPFEKGELVTVEGVSGFDVGEVSLTGELVRLQMKKRKVDELHPDMKKIIRRSSEKDIQLFEQQKAREPEALMRCRAVSRQLNLQMKLSEIEFQADGRKGTFYYTADDRVDFREMIKIFASEFKVKVEMRQIGIRQDAGKVGGIGSCGRELCCSTWLTDFKSVTTTAARYQNLSINQTKLSGQCGRLKCCLNYELDTYLDALQNFPNNADSLQLAKGNATLVKKDIFKNLMWYMLHDSNRQYPVTITRVRDIIRMNAKGERPEELEAVEVTASKPKETEPTFVDVVGQISLRSLERNSKKRKDKEREDDRRGGRQEAQPQRGKSNAPQADGKPPMQSRQGGQQQPQRGGQQPQRNQPQQKQGQSNQPRPQQSQRPPQKNNQQHGGQKRNTPPNQNNQQRPNREQQPPPPAKPDGQD